MECSYNIRDKCEALLQKGNIQSFIDFFYVTHGASSTKPASKKSKFSTNMIQCDDVAFVQNKLDDIDGIRIKENQMITSSTSSNNKHKHVNEKQQQQKHQQEIRNNYNELAKYFYDKKNVDDDHVKKSAYFYHQSLKISASLSNKYKHDNYINDTTMNYEYHTILHDQMIDFKYLGLCYQCMDTTTITTTIPLTTTTRSSIISKSTNKDKYSTFALTNAIKYYEQWMKYARKINNTNEKAEAVKSLLQVYMKFAEYNNHTTSGIGDDYDNKKGMEVALEYYVKSLECSRTLKDRDMECSLCHKIGSLYIRLGQDKKGDEYIKEYNHMSKALAAVSKEKS